MTKVTYRQAVEKDIPAIAAMLRPMYQLQRPEEYLHWQFFKNMNPVVLMSGYSNEEIVGIFGVQKRMVTGNLVCGQASWLNIAPQWQGKGIFEAIGKEAIGYYKDLDMVCVFANARARESCESSLGLRMIGVIKMMVLDASRLTFTEGDVTYESVNSNIHFEGFLGGVRQWSMFQYSHAYRSWRYATNPFYKYGKVTLDSGEYAVVKKFTDPVNKVCFGDIVDIECSLKDREKMKRLFIRASSSLKQGGAEKITTWAMPQSLLLEVVKDLGFVESTCETYFGLNVLKSQYDYLYDFARWYLREADATNY